MDIKLAEYPSTEALIEALLKNKNLGQVKNITVKDLDIAGASGVGSVPVLAEVELENQGGKCEKLKLFVKVCEKGTPPWWAQEVAHTMTKEVTFYEDMLPKISKFQDEKGITDPKERIDLLIPKYYGSGLVGGTKMVVVLDNIIEQGFKPVGKKEFHQTSKVLASLRNLAVFHATTFAMQELGFIDWTKDYSKLKDYIHAKDQKTTMGQFHIGTNDHYLGVIEGIVKQQDNQLVKDNISRLCNLELIKELKGFQGDIYDILRETRSPEGSTHGLLCHGDYHMWNVCFNQDNTKTMMFDFQILCYGSALTDVHYYLCQCTKPLERADNLERFLQAYADTFQDYGARLGIHEKKLTNWKLQPLLDEYKKRSPFGYAFGLHYFIIRLVENKELFSKTKDMQDDSATLIQTLNDCGATTWAIMQDAMDMLNQLKDLGTIEEMKKIQEKLRNEN